MPTNLTSEEDRILPIEPSGSHGQRLFRIFWALRFGIVGLCIAGLAIPIWGKGDLRGAGMMLSLGIAILCIGRLFVLANRAHETPAEPPRQPPPDP